MNIKRGPMDASEFMAELEKNKEYMAAMKAKEERRLEAVERNMEIIKPYMDRLHAIGALGDTFEEVVENHAPLPKQVIDILLDAVEQIEDRNMAESAVRSLAATIEPFDGRPLARLFDRTRGDLLKWAIINTVVCANVTGIDDWIESNLRSNNRRWGVVFRDLGGR